jgi:hypothetical protein
MRRTPRKDPPPHASVRAKGWLQKSRNSWLFGVALLLCAGVVLGPGIRAFQPLGKTPTSSRLPARISGAAEHQINSFVSGRQYEPMVFLTGNGALESRWLSEGHASREPGAYGQRFDSQGYRLGEEFPVRDQQGDSAPTSSKR